MKEDDNVSDSEFNFKDKNDESMINLNKDEKECSEITIDVIE